MSPTTMITEFLTSVTRSQFKVTVRTNHNFGEFDITLERGIKSNSWILNAYDDDTGHIIRMSLVDGEWKIFEFHFDDFVFSNGILNYTVYSSWQNKSEDSITIGNEFFDIGENIDVILGIADPKVNFGPLPRYIKAVKDFSLYVMGTALNEDIHITEEQFTNIMSNFDYTSIVSAEALLNKKQMKHLIKLICIIDDCYQ